MTSLREKQIDSVDKLIKSASYYVKNGELLNREQIVTQCCNKHIIDLIDKKIPKLVIDMNLEFTKYYQGYREALEELKQEIQK